MFFFGNCCISIIFYPGSTLVDHVVTALTAWKTNVISIRHYVYAVIFLTKNRDS